MRFYNITTKHSINELDVLCFGGIKIDGQKIIVTPNNDYVADIPYTLVIQPGLESEQGVKLQQGTHLTFTFN